MSRSNIDIAVNVHDAATGKLRGASREVDNFGKSVKKASIDVTQFNRVMFSTTAYIGLFTSGFQRFTTFLTEGANLDRLTNQFERVLGPRGEFFQQIKGFTTTAVDRFEAMRAGIELKSLGIVHNTGQIAELVARAGTAAKLAGKDSGEGIKHFTKFLKDGSVGNLEFLNLIARTNPALQAQMAILQKAGGTMGGVISTQARLALGYRLLREATRGAMKGQRDLADIMLDLRQSFTFMRGSIGRFLGTALAPLLEKVVDLVDKFTDFLENVRKNEKNLLFLAKAFIVTTAAVAGLAAAFGTLRLATIALGSLGIGLPSLLGIVSGLSLAFLGITNSVDGFMNKLKLFAAFFRGTFQLVHSFLTDPENFAKGIGKMDESIAKLLDKHGLLGLATNLARVSAIIIRFVSDVGQKLIDWFQKIDKMIGNIVGGLKKILGIDSGPWSRGWIESGNKIRDTLVSVTSAAMMLFGLFRVLRVGGGLIGGVTGLFGRILGFRGGPGSGPKGTATDPIFVVDMKTGLLSVGKGAKKTGENLLAMFGFLGADLFKVRWLEILDILKNAGGFLRGGFGTISRLVGSIARIWAPIAVIGTALYGVFQGIVATSEEWKKFFTGIFSLGKAIVNLILNFEPLRQVVDLVSTGFSMLGDAIVDLLKMIAKGWENIAGWVGVGAGKIGEIAQNLADKISGNKKERVPPKVAGTDIPALDIGNKLATTGQTGGIPTSSANPAMPESEDEKQQQIADMIKTLDKSQQAATSQAFFQAMSKSSAGGAEITPEEWVAIFAKGLDRSQNLKKVADKEVKVPNSASTPRR